MWLAERLETEATIGRSGPNEGRLQVPAPKSARNRGTSSKFHELFPKFRGNPSISREFGSAAAPPHSAAGPCPPAGTAGGGARARRAAPPAGVRASVVELIATVTPKPRFFAKFREIWWE